MNYEIFRNKFLRKTLASWCAFATLATMCGPAWAAAATGSYLGGAADLNRASSGVDNYGTQTSSYAGFTAGGGAGVLDWNKLNVPASATLEFNNGTFYNVVNSAGKMSMIEGMIKGTDGANVSIFNPNGISIANGASVSVEGIFGAFAFGIEGSDLDNWINSGTMPAIVKGTAAEMKGDITVNGGASLSAAQIALAGKNVYTKDDSSFKGATTLAAGDKIETKIVIDASGAGTISMTIPDTATEGQINLLGEFADALTANAAKDVLVEDGTLTVDGNLTVNAGNNKNVTQPGNFVVDNANIDVQEGTLTVTAKGGADIQGATRVEAKNSIEITANNGLFTLGGKSATEPAVLKSTDGGVAIDAAQAIKLQQGGQVDGKTEVSLTAQGVKEGPQDITIEGAGTSVKSAGELTMISKNGSITEDADATIIANGDASFYAKDDTEVTHGDITLAGTANDFSQGGVDKVVNAEAKNVTINEGGTVDDTNKGISLGTVTATDGDVKVTDTTGSVTVKTLVKAGEIDEATPAFGTKTGNLSIEAAKSVTFAENSKAGANGTVTVKANGTDAEDGLFVNNAKLVANDAMTLDAAKAVTINNGAYVGGMKTIKIGGTTAPETLTVKGDGTKLEAGGLGSDGKNKALDVTAGKILVEDKARIGAGADDDTAYGYLTLTATDEGGITVQSGAKVIGKNNVQIHGDGGAILIQGGAQIEGAATKVIAQNHDVTISGEGTLVKSKGDNNVYAKYDDTKPMESGNVTVKDGAKIVSTENSVEIYAQKGDMLVTGGATVEAAESARVYAGLKNLTVGNVTISDGATIHGSKDSISYKAVEIRGQENVTIDNATVKAGDFTVNPTTGEITESTSEGAASITAGKTLAIQNGAQVGVNGAATVTAKDTTVDNAKLAASGAMTIDTLTDGEGSVSVKNGAVVAAVGALNIGSEKTPETFSVNDAQVVAKGDIFANAGAITVENGAKVASDMTMTLNAKTGDVTVQSGAKTLADGELYLESEKVNVTVDNATVAGKDGVTVTASKGTFTAKENAVVKAGEIDETSQEPVDSKNMSISAQTVEIKSGAKVAASGEEKVVADAITVEGSDTALAGRTVVMDAKTAAGTMTVKDAATVAAYDTLTIGGTKAPASLTVDDAQVVAKGDLEATATEILVQNNAKVASDANATLKATVGDITVDAAKLLAKGNIDATATGAILANNAATVAAKQNIEANAAAIGVWGGSSISAGGNLTATASSADADPVTAISVVNSKVTAGGDATVKATAGSVMATDGAEVTVNGKADVQAAQNVLAVKGAKVVVVGDAKVEATAGNVMVSKAGGDTTTVTVGGKLDVDAGTDVIASESEILAIGDTTVDATKNIKLDSAKFTTAGTLTAKAAEGDISAENFSTVLAKGNVKLDADAGSITAKDATLVGTEGDLEANAKKNVVVDNSATVDVAGKADVVADNAIAVWNNSTVKVGGNLTATANGADADPVTAISVVDSKVTAGGDATVKATAGSILATEQSEITVFGNADVTAQKNVAVLKGTKTLVGGNATFRATEGTAMIAAMGAEAPSVNVGGSLDVDAGTDAIANEANIYAVGNATVEAGRNVRIENATVRTEGALALTAKNDIDVTGLSFLTAGKSATLHSTDAGNITIDTTGNVTANDEVTAETESGDILVENATVQSNQKDVRLIAQPANGVTVQKSAKIAAAKNVFIHADDITIGDAATADATSVTAGEGVRMESPNGEVDIFSKVAGKNVTIVSEKESTGSKVLIDAQYLTDKNILTANDGSIYVDTVANDIALNNGAVISATDATGADSSAAGNILLRSEYGSVRPTEGKARIVADNGKGVAALVGGGTVGNKDLTIKAGVVVLRSTGEGVEAPDVVATFEGDTKLVAKAVNDVDVDIVNGTLTIVNKADALAGEYVNEVKYPMPETPATPVVATLEKHTLEAYADSSRGAEAGNDIKITGQNANLVIANNSAAIAGHDVKTVMDHNTTVYGTVKAGHNDYLTTGGNLATPGAGKIVAGNDLVVDVGTSTPMVNIAVGKGVSARSGEREIAFRTVGGYEYPEVYGNDSETTVFIDGRVAGGNSADFSILQGYEQVAAFGNVQLTPVFTHAANVFPLLNFTDMQAPAAAFAQGYLSSDKGEITRLDDAEEDPVVATPAP